jgi:two-component system response regulator AtoC
VRFKSRYIPPGTEQALFVNRAVHFRIKKGATYMIDLLVFAVSPDQAVRNMAQVAVSEEGHHLQTFPTSAHLLAALRENITPHLVLLESEPNSGESYNKLLRHVPETSLCFLMKPGEHPASPIARKFAKARFLTKPILRADIEAVLDDVAHSLQLDEVFGINRISSESKECPATASGTDRPPELIIDDLGDGRYFLALSPAMLEIYRQVRLLDGIDASVLILGESGTGKEIIAHLLHNHSRRAQNKFVKVNCAALPMDLLESELFGHVKGAFTGAISDRPGRFEQSSGGTILLDEIGEISVAMQAKLLHVLQDGQFTRLGGRQSTKVDVHILAATNIEMEQALADKTFREDLYYRLNTFTFHVPPLRERTEEIPFLVSEMIWRTPPSMKPPGFRQFSAGLMNVLPFYDWPGNLRELQNFTTRTMVMQDEGDAIRELESKIDKRGAVKMRCATTNSMQQKRPLRSLVQDVKYHAETRMIEEVLLECGWNRRHAARKLSISYRSLLYKIQQYQLSPHGRRLSA